ncbi:hypothetical protein Nepgr_004780 [Nepenthes gracilis]|uniref:Amine oxidase domain-containing protein n=1 Tax=Nepenthes gracilis TaxID=150966 RepID=A0AAD3XFS5_NEPGR|nr:hypothetical protein Nepgr_004780 [Nepenthes gracilis]
MLSLWKVTLCYTNLRNRGFNCRAESLESRGLNNGQKQSKKKVLVVGSGWAGLGATYHLCKQGFDVTVLEGGVDSGLNAEPCSPDEVGIQGFWYPYRNIFSLVDEIGIKPFTSWVRSAHYSVEGMEVEFPIFQDQPQLPSPLGVLTHTQFTRLPLLDRLTLLPLIAAAVDFDNTDAAWRNYDPITARELLRQFGCSERLYRDVIDPLLEVRLFAPAEQCSAAATLAVLYYYVLAHQKNFDVMMCRGTVREKIFEPWKDLLRSEGCEFRKGRAATDFFFSEETGCISEVICGNDRVKADAVILAVGISSIQEIVKKSSALCAREEFLKVLNMVGSDAVSAKLRLDIKVTIPNACNACSRFGSSSAWTFFDLNAIFDEHENDPATTLQADFYHANEFLPLSDEQIVSKVMSYLSKCIVGFENAKVIDKEIRRFPKSLTHFFPGSYKHMMRGSTSFPNLFMAGDWIINRHGSWSQEKSFVTGLEAANMVVDYLGEGSFAKIIPVEEDEPHIEVLCSFSRNLNEIRSQLPWSSYFLK